MTDSRDDAAVMLVEIAAMMRRVAAAQREEFPETAHRDDTGSAKALVVAEFLETAPAELAALRAEVARLRELLPTEKERGDLTCANNWLSFESRRANARIIVSYLDRLLEGLAGG